MTVSRTSLNETLFPAGNQYSTSRTNQKEESVIQASENASNFVLPTTQVEKVLYFEDHSNRAETTVDDIHSEDTK